jgi:hypothetical protein
MATNRAEWLAYWKRAHEIDEHNRASDARANYRLPTMLKGSGVRRRKGGSIWDGFKPSQRIGIRPLNGPGSRMYEDMHKNILKPVLGGHIGMVTGRGAAVFDNSNSKGFRRRHQL